MIKRIRKKVGYVVVSFRFKWDAWILGIDWHWPEAYQEWDELPRCYEVGLYVGPAQLNIRW